MKTLDSPKWKLIFQDDPRSPWWMMTHCPSTKAKVILSNIILKLQIHNYTDKYCDIFKRNIILNDKTNITCIRRLFKSRFRVSFPKNTLQRLKSYINTINSQLTPVLTPFTCEYEWCLSIIINSTYRLWINVSRMSRSTMNAHAPLKQQT